MPVTATRAPRSFLRLVWATLVVTLLVIIWGALVRATKSGAGCGTDWPHCNGQAIPIDASAKTLIEYTHRVTSGMVMLMALAVSWAARKLPRGPTRTWAHIALGFMLLEAALGAALVKFGLVVDNDSLARAIVMSLHLVNTLLLVGAQSLCLWFARGGAALDLRRPGPERWMWAGAIVGFLLLGVTGALTALGDTLFPVDTIREGIAQHRGAEHTLLRLRVWHPLLALAIGGGLFGWAAWLKRRRPTPEVLWWASAVQLIYVAQILVGVINLVLLAPVAMQLIHLLMADVSWISIIFLGAATLSRVPEDVAATPPSDAARAA